MLASFGNSMSMNMRKTKRETIKPTFSFPLLCRQCGLTDHPEGENLHEAPLPSPEDLRVLFAGVITCLRIILYPHNSNLIFRTSNAQRSPEKQLSEALSAMSVGDARSRPLGLSQDQVNTLHDAACAPGGPITGQGHDPHQTSAMDRYMEMKTKQELDNITCNHWSNSKLATVFPKQVGMCHKSFYLHSPDLQVLEVTPAMVFWPKLFPHPSIWTYLYCLYNIPTNAFEYYSLPCW